MSHARILARENWEELNAQDGWDRALFQADEFCRAEISKAKRQLAEAVDASFLFPFDLRESVGYSELERDWDLFLSRKSLAEGRAASMRREADRAHGSKMAELRGVSTDFPRPAPRTA